jgi:hypothetical protein
MHTHVLCSTVPSQYSTIPGDQTPDTQIGVIGESLRTLHLHTHVLHGTRASRCRTTLRDRTPHPNWCHLRKTHAMHTHVLCSTLPSQYSTFPGDQTPDTQIDVISESLRALHLHTHVLRGTRASRCRTTLRDRTPHPNWCHLRKTHAMHTHVLCSTVPSQYSTIPGEQTPPTRGTQACANQEHYMLSTPPRSATLCQALQSRPR